MRVLDLFCGAGGAALGLSRAGFDVVGVDIAAQPRYPFAFVQADALTYPVEGFDLVWASPPCQRYSMFSRNLGIAHRHPDLVARVRKRLRKARVPYIIENVVGAPLKDPFMLCGTMFGLNLLRHRLFETSFPVRGILPCCAHTGREIPVYGNGTSVWHRQKLGRNVSTAEKAESMAIDHMTGKELAQAIPPAYSQWLAEQFLESLTKQVSA